MVIHQRITLEPMGLISLKSKMVSINGRAASVLDVLACVIILKTNPLHQLRLYKEGIKRDSIYQH